MSRVFIIAEAGVNHNGSIDIARRMIDKAANAGVDAIKFQSFISENIVTKNTALADYQKKNIKDTGSQLEMLKKLEIDKESQKELVSYCNKKKIMFLSTPFDIQSLDLLTEFGLETYKISSGDITNLPLLRCVGSLKKKVIFSTGMSNMDEVRQAYDVLQKSGTLKENIIVLHCNTEYPTPYKDVNLNAMQSIKNELKCNIGYSDHTLGFEVSLAAVALGASIIEKHFTLDRNMEGPDHKASLEPDELKTLVHAIRNIEVSLGDGIKKPSKSEFKNINIVRKSIVASSEIIKGEILSQDNITTKRPGLGISPMNWDKVLGEIAKKDFKKDDLIEL